MKLAPTTKYKKRSAGRIGAIQTLYAVKMGQQDIVKAMADFIKNDAMVEMDGISYPANQQVYAHIINGVLARDKDIVGVADAVLTKRPLERQNPLMQLILKAGIFELLENDTIDSRLIISEYVDIAHAFFDPKEAGMVNGVLDSVSRTVR